MGNLVVVAIPAQDERVWKVSSEKVPHLTLLFLGDADSNPNTERITEFVDHAVTVCEHGPFMLDVDYRGVLGPDEADVLFFKKGWSAKWIEQFRNSLLQNTDIRAAYESTDQFPEWQPHLTLGYPATPANADDSEHGIRWVSFDRIAVWTGDYAGAEFRLEWPEMDYGGALAYSQETRLGMQFLEHHGVKGMKWGTRKTNRQFAKSDKLMTEAKALEKKSVTSNSVHSHLLRNKAMKKRIESTSLHSQVTNKVLDQTYKSAQKDLNKLKEKPEFQGIHYRDENGHPQIDVNKFRAYDKASGVIIGQHMAKTVEGYKFGLDTSNGEWKLTADKIQHADSSFITIKPIRDIDGYIVGLELVSSDTGDSMAQTTELGAEFLAHHGIKGMHWGHRKEQVQQRLHAQRVTAEAAKRAQRPAQTVRAYPTIGPSKHKPGNIATKGGEDHPPTKDAIKVAEARQKIKKSGLHALTNDELRDVATRLNLEQQVVTLEGKRGKQKSLGRKFIEGVLNDKGTQKKASEFVFNQVSKKTG